MKNRYLSKNNNLVEYNSCPIFNEQGEKVLVCFNTNKSLISYKGSNCSLEIYENTVEMKINDETLKIIFVSDIEIEPTYNGIKIETSSNVCNFNVITCGQNKIKSNERYLVFYSKNEQPQIIVSTLYCEDNGKKEKTKINYIEKSDKCEIQVCGNEKSCKTVFEINAYEPKLIFDTTVGEENPDANNCFGGVAFLSKNKPKEKLYMRFDFTKITDIKASQVEQVLLCIPVFSKGETKLQIQKVKEPWCSVGMNWINKAQGGDILGESKAENSIVQFDITKTFKAMLKMQTKKNYGYIISNVEDDIAVVSTGDNYFKPQKIIIKIKE